MVFYVSAKSGSDTNDGRSRAKAFRSIHHAIDVAGSGDTLLVAPGAYDQDFDKQVGAARSAGLTVTVAGSEA